MDYNRLASICKALGDDTRIKIIKMLSDGELCACKILEEFKITQPTLSYHMKTLCDAYLVKCDKRGIWCYYSIDINALNELREYFDCFGK